MSQSLPEPLQSGIKTVGDTIDIDEILLEISTDKVESEIPSPFAGRVEKLLFEEGETVDIGIEIAVIEDDLSLKPQEETRETPSTEENKSKGPSYPLNLLSERDRLNDVFTHLL